MISSKAAANPSAAKRFQLHRRWKGMFAKQPVCKVYPRYIAMRKFGFDRLYNKSIVRIPATGETDFMPAWADEPIQEGAAAFTVKEQGDVQ